jgi:DnaJ-class molecular chaperone
MARKNYYVILGVSHTETPRGIQQAYRALAQRHHPDRVGSDSTAAFQEIVEAYEVLSDPQRRQAYNQSLSIARPPDIAQFEPTTDRDRSRPEPLIPEPSDPWPPFRPEPLISETLSIRRDFGTFSPSFEALADRLMRNVTGIGSPKGERVESLHLEIVLSPAEAMRGGVIRIGVPTFSPCPDCQGSGRDWYSICLTCTGRGMVEHETPVAVRIPPMIRPGSILEIPLRGLGIHNFYLRIHIRIAA